jgi:hypothetical protein
MSTSSISIVSTLTPPFSAIVSNALIPGNPRAERGISFATLPSSRKIAPRNVFISANGLIFGGGGRWGGGEAELSQPEGREETISRLIPWRGVDWPLVE